MGQEGRAAEDLPLLGRSHHLVIADTDAEALDVARPAYEEWFASLDFLWKEYGTRVRCRSPPTPTTRWPAASASPDRRRRCATGCSTNATGRA